MDTRLTQGQELYVQARMRGLTQRRAYREAYPGSAGWKDKTVDEKACTLEARPEVSARLGELRRRSAERAVLSRARVLSRLDRLADASAEALEARWAEGGRIDPVASQALVSASKELLPYCQDEGQGESPPFVADFAMLISPDFFAAHRALGTGAGGDFWLEGGRGSAKSSFCALEVVRLIEADPQRHALVLMKHKVNLRDACYSQVVWALHELGLDGDYDMPDSMLRITKKATGQVIYFRGCDNASKVKSIKPKFGHIGVVWFEEADMFRDMAEIRKVNQSASRGGDGVVRLYSFNPPRSTLSWANAEMARRREAGLPVWRSCYTSVPREWLGEQFVADAEALRESDPKAYRHEYLGEAVGMGLEVFDPERVVFREVSDEEIASFENLRVGQDFGWYPDPWALTVSEWRRDGRTLITFREDGGNKLQPAQQAERIKAALSLPFLRPDGTLGEERHQLRVLSDDADPTAIAAQRDAGVDARSAGKGGLRAASYRFIQSSTWVIDPRRCPRLADEVRRKQYEANDAGEACGEIPDGGDHWIDATRYALMADVARAREAYRGRAATPMAT